jgi:hypothetical protein
MTEKIISGGQTGADQRALVAAINRSIRKRLKGTHRLSVVESSKET